MPRPARCSATTASTFWRHGVDVTLHKRLADGWMLDVSASWNAAAWHIPEATFDYTNPDKRRAEAGHGVPPCPHRAGSSRCRVPCACPGDSPLRPPSRPARSWGPRSGVASRTGACWGRPSWTLGRYGSERYPGGEPTRLADRMGIEDRAREHRPGPERVQFAQLECGSGAQPCSEHVVGQRRHPGPRAAPGARGRKRHVLQLTLILLHLDGRPVGEHLGHAAHYLVGVAIPRRRTTRLAAQPGGGGDQVRVYGRGHAALLRIDLDDRVGVVAVAPAREAEERHLDWGAPARAVCGQRDSVPRDGDACPRPAGWT